MPVPPVGVPSRFINLDFNDPNGLRAQDIPYDATQSILDAINARVPTKGVSDAGALSGTATWTPNMNNGDQHTATVAAGADVTIAAPTNAKISSVLILRVTNGGAANSVTWDQGFRFAGSAPTLTVSGVDQFKFVYDGLLWNSHGLDMVAPPPPPEFITTWETTTVDETISLPLTIASSYNMLVDWGDGTQDTITSYNQAEKTHAYTTPGVQTITITGTCTGLNAASGDKLKFRTVEQWGDVGFTGEGLASAFTYCSNATSFGSKIPYYPVTSLAYTWKGCSQVAQFPDISALTDVTSLYETWSGCSLPTSFPGVSMLVDVTTMYSTWGNCSSMLLVPELMSFAHNLENVNNLFNGVGAQMTGTVVELWNTTNFPSIGAYHINTFNGCTGLDNYADIPSDWK